MQKVKDAVEEYGIKKIYSSKIKEYGDLGIPVEEGAGVEVRCERRRTWDGEKERLEDLYLREIEARRVLEDLL